MEAFGEVLGLVIPGAGNVFPALQLAYELCQGLGECGEVCRLVRGRFQQLLDAIVDLDGRRKLPKGSVLPKFRDALGAFIAFMQRHQNKNVLLRLASNRSIMEQVQRTNEEIDVLFKLLQLEHMGEMMDWRTATSHCWERQQSEMQELLTNQREITQMLQDAGLLEALALLKYESQYQREKNTPSQLQMMDQTFYRAVRASKASVPSIPPWFIPSDDVVYAVESFEDGEFGRAHRGKWNHTEVVIKTLLASDAKTKDSFLKEAGIWIKLNHPHVLDLYGGCHVSSPPFFVCEDAEQGNFRQFFGQGQNRHVFWRLFREVMNGMLYLAKEKIVHGNLKCNNLLVGADGKAKIADFGFSFIRSESRALSKKSQVDSVRWKAPECIRGDVENPDLRSDVYSLGMCIIEAWTGDVPWGNQCSEAQISDLAYEFRMPLQPVDMSDRAWQLLKRMCHPHPSKRIALINAASEISAMVEQQSQGSNQTCPGADCVATIIEGSRFCASCGYKIVGTPSVSTPAPLSHSPSIVAFEAKMNALAALCDETHEYQLLCHHVRSRLQDVFKQLSIRDRQRKLPNSDIMRGCLDLADRFRLFLEDLCTKASIVALVVCRRGVLASLEQLHFAIDSLVELLNIAEVETWQQQWQANRAILRTTMQHRVASASDLSKLVPERKAQNEAIQKLRAEIDKGAGQNPPDHQALMLGLLDRIRRLLVTSPGLFQLTVTLVKATDLVAADYWKGSSDPYVILALRGDNHRSAMHPHELNPVWNQSFQFTVDTRTGQSTHHHLVIQVWDHDTFTPDDLIGTLSLPIETLLQERPHPHSVVAYPLQIPSQYASQNRQSKIHLKMAFQRIS